MSAVLDIADLGAGYGGRRIIEQVSLTVAAGEIVTVIGHNGAGKSTLLRAVFNLVPWRQGRITLEGKDVFNLPPERLLAAGIAYVPQHRSVFPRLTIEDSIAFGPKVRGVAAAEAVAKAHDLLRRVGLAPELFARRYPHELSGGQRQRVNIARALALAPRLLILDEPVSALDKSVEAQVLNLLVDLKESLGLTYIFVSHDLNVVQYISDRVLVMYLGRIAEIGPVEAIYKDARHLYTRALLSAMPSMDPDRRTQEAPIAGDPPNPINPPPGCVFHTRCPYAEEVCKDRKSTRLNSSH